MVMESHETISTVLDALISTLLTQIPLSPENTPPVRIASLRCLAILPTQLSLEAIDPFKKLVIRRVGEVLDDPKRNVRKEAVDCRHAWYSSSDKIS
jgi:DNA repair/transcription protein MET18/MMS19